jgi:RNA polymerase sigma-70 factor (ECF subfamily)
MPQGDDTSLSLLQRVRDQDQAAWQRLVTLYGPLVYRWCHRAGVEGEDARDVVQEVFLAVAQGLAGFAHQHVGGFRGWVRGITRHKVLDHYRRQGRQPAAAGGSEALRQLHAVAEADLPDEDDAEVSDLYRRALELIRGAFEERTWQAFWGTVVEGQDTAVVAGNLGMSAVGVRVARSRVLARLRHELADLLD